MVAIPANKARTAPKELAGEETRGGSEQAETPAGRQEVTGNPQTPLGDACGAAGSRLSLLLGAASPDYSARNPSRRRQPIRVASRAAPAGTCRQAAGPGEEEAVAPRPEGGTAQGAGGTAARYPRRPCQTPARCGRPLPPRRCELRERRSAAVSRGAPRRSSGLGAARGGLGLGGVLRPQGVCGTGGAFPAGPGRFSAGGTGRRGAGGGGARSGPPGAPAGAGSRGERDSALAACRPRPGRACTDPLPRLEPVPSAGSALHGVGIHGLDNK